MLKQITSLREHFGISQCKNVVPYCEKYEKKKDKPVKNVKDNRRKIIRIEHKSLRDLKDTNKKSIR